MPSAIDDPYQAPTRALKGASVVSSRYSKRLAVTWPASFAVVNSYAVALHLASEIEAGVHAAIALVAAVTSLLSGAITALVLRNYPIAMVVATQLASIAIIGAFWAL